MVLYVQPELCKYTGRVIYKLIFPDRKVYIGMASISQKRIDGHRKEAYAKTDGDWNNKSRCKKAIRKFGWDNVQVEIMEFVPKWTSLRNRERYWIAQYQSWKEEYGYNSNKGGGGVIQHTEEAKAKISAAHEKKPVTSCKIKESYANGTQLVEFVSYPSAMEAGRKTEVNNGDISACCNKKKKSAGERYWFFTAENHPPQIIKVGTIRVPRIGDKPITREQSKRAVISTSPNKEKQRHESAYAAARTLSKATKKKFSASAITACCKGKRTRHQGYTFCYE